MKVRLNSFLEKTKVLGPGTRCAIWFQGCKRHCKGCMSENSRPFDGGFETDVQVLVKKIVSINGIEGVTVSGGDPFYQPDALFDLLSTIKKQTDLSVIIYTGFYLKELRDMHNEKVDSIIDALADIIIDGPYVEELNDNKSLRGSGNQTVHFLTNRYSNQTSLYGGDTRNVEIIAGTKSVIMVGIPEKRLLENWKKNLH